MARFWTFILVALTFTACFSKTNTVKAITPLETQGMLRNDFAVVLDVREEGEVKEGMAQGALWIAKSKIDADAPEWKSFLEKHPKHKQIIVYCRSGNRSGKVADLLVKQGYQVSNMGTFSSWQKAGLPVTIPH